MNWKQLNPDGSITDPDKNFQRMLDDYEAGRAEAFAKSGLTLGCKVRLLDSYFNYYYRDKSLRRGDVGTVTRVEAYNERIFVDVNWAVDVEVGVPLEYVEKI